MTQKISVLPWQQFSNAIWYARVECSVVDTYEVSVRGNITNEIKNVLPQLVIVDNYANDEPCSFGYGGVSFTVGRYTRQTFQIPLGVNAVVVTVGAAPVILTFFEKLDLLPDGADAFAIQQAAAQFVVYTWLTKSAGGSQLATDQNKNIDLTNVSAQNYNLLGIAANGIPNGWYNPRIRNVGPGRWSIVPAGADQINSIYTNASPLLMSLGDKIELWSDGVQWRAAGVISYTSALIPLSAGAGAALPHGLGQVPTYLEGWLQCTTAEQGFAIGERVRWNHMYVNSGQGYGIVQKVDTTNISYRMAAGANVISALHDNTGAPVNYTNTSWSWQIKAYLEL